MKVLRDCNITLTSICMEREEFLMKVLPFWLELPFDEIQLIDNNTAPTLPSIVTKDPRVKIVWVEGEPTLYDHSLLTNYSFELAKNEMVFRVDSDIIVTDLLFDTRCNYKEFLHGPGNNGLVGTMFISKTDFNTVGGFKEDDGAIYAADLELYNRLQKANIRARTFDPKAIFHLPHSNDLRMKNRLELTRENRPRRTVDNRRIRRTLTPDRKNRVPQPVLTEQDYKANMNLINKANPTFHVYRLIENEYQLVETKKRIDNLSSS